MPPQSTPSCLREPTHRSNPLNPLFNTLLLRLLLLLPPLPLLLCVDPERSQNHLAPLYALRYCNLPPSPKENKNQKRNHPPTPGQAMGHCRSNSVICCAQGEVARSPSLIALIAPSKYQLERKPRASSSTFFGLPSTLFFRLSSDPLWAPSRKEKLCRRRMKASRLERMCRKEMWFLW